MGCINYNVEEPDRYHITIDNELVFGEYFVDNITGKECKGAIEGSYDPIPDLPELIEADPMIEITD